MKMQIQTKYEYIFAMMQMKKNCDIESAHWDNFFSEMNDTLIFQMHRIHSVMFRVANSLIHEASVPVKMEQLPILMCIYNCGSVSQQEVADIVHRDKSSVQRTVVVLEKKGLITITQDKKDKRRNILRTTETGNFVALQIKDIIKKVEEEIFSAFNSEDKLNTINTIKETADKLELLQN
jgi:DNA-binding MarR family transcriptional regulator